MKTGIYTLCSFSLQELGVELWSGLWDSPRRLPILHSWHGQGSQDVPSQVKAPFDLLFPNGFSDVFLVSVFLQIRVVVASHSLLHHHLRVRRMPSFLPAPESRWLVGAGDLLLKMSLLLSRHVRLPYLLLYYWGDLIRLRVANHFNNCSKGHQQHYFNSTSSTSDDTHNTTGRIGN